MPSSRSPLGYLWASPATAIGVVVLSLAAWRGRVALVDGVIEGTGPLIGVLLRRGLPVPGGAIAITLGHVVLAVDEHTLEQVRGHELVHVAQYERWGPLFIPAYLLASVWALLRGRPAYRGNAFEIEAWSADLEPPFGDGYQ